MLLVYRQLSCSTDFNAEIDHRASLVTYSDFWDLSEKHAGLSFRVILTLYWYLEVIRAYNTYFLLYARMCDMDSLYYSRFLQFPSHYFNSNPLNPNGIFRASVKIFKTVAYFRNFLSLSGETRPGHMNIKAVFLHIMADALGSVIVMVTSLVLHFVPGNPDDSKYKWKLYLDPCLR